MRTIRLMPVEFGYGPLGKALHIGRAIRALAGSSVRLELVASENFRSPVESGVFDRCVPDIHGAAPADAVVTVMNIAGIRSAARRGERVYVVDSLAWLWDEPLPVQELIQVYFYQDLPILPVPGRNLAGMPSPTPISAIGRLPDTEPLPAVRPPGRTVVSLSGIESPGARAAVDSLPYPPYLLDSLELLVESGEVGPEELDLFGNTAVLRRFAGGRLAGALREGSQREFAAAARAAGSIACPPGLTTIVECLRSGVGLRLLPPQNFSQVKIMRAVVEATGVPALPWTGEIERWLQDAVIPEVVGAGIVRGIAASRRLDRGHADPRALLALLRTESPPMAGAEVDRLIGPDDGASAVAARVLADLPS